MNINLSKEALQSAVKINLSKAGFDTSKLSAKVAFALDESGSMAHLYRNGSVQAILDKLLAVSMFLDDDGDVDMWAFGSRARALPQATQDDHGDYKFDPMYSGTSYHEVTGQIKEFYYGGTDKVVKKAGFIGKLFGKKDVVVKGVSEGRADSSDNHPVYLFFLTDGETMTAGQDIPALVSLMAEHPDLYIQFIGLGRDNFTTLDKIVAQNPKQSNLIKVTNLGQEGDALLEKLITTDVKNIIQA